KKPDWESARPLYDEAAVIFRNAKAYDHAVEAYAKSAAANKEEGSLFIAGKQLEQGAQILAQFLQKSDEAAKLFREASNYFLAHGSPDRAAEMLEKAAKQLENSNVNESLELYREACSIYESEDKLRTGVDTFTRAVSMALRANKLLEAVEFSGRLTEAFQKMQNLPSYKKQALSTIIIVLLLGDDVDASKRLTAYGSNTGFLETEEGSIAESLVTAFQTYDEEELANALKRQTVKFLETEVKPFLLCPL
ncbi:soluble NSF attachment protein, partial [Chytridium lagenaria]